MEENNSSSKTGTSLIAKPSMMIPISHELIAHVKRLDTFNDEEIIKLKHLLYELVPIQNGSDSM
jgi:hypothetical protein